MADLISKREEAIEAWAAAVDAAYNPDRCPIMAAMFHDYADAGLDAALAIDGGRLHAAQHIAHVGAFLHLLQGGHDFDALGAFVERIGGATGQGREG